MLWVRVPPPELISAMRAGLTIGELRDWELHGAIWRVLELTDTNCLVDGSNISS